MTLNKEKNNTHIRIYIITENYSTNIKNIINNTKNNKELKKYTKWYIFVRYIKIILKLYLQKYINIQYFIKNTELIYGTSKIVTPNDTLLFFNIFIPNRHILCSIGKYLNKNELNFINDIIYDELTNKYLCKMINNIYFIIHNNSHLCWQFKNDSKIIELKYVSVNNLSIYHDTTNIYIKYKKDNLNCYDSKPLNTYHITDDISQDNEISDIDSICSEHDIYDDVNSMCYDDSYYNKPILKKQTLNCKTIKLNLCSYNHENINKKTTPYDYIYDIIKNSCILYIYIIVVIIKYYTNINILNYNSFRRLIYIINFNR